MKYDWRSAGDVSSCDILTAFVSSGEVSRCETVTSLKQGPPGLLRFRLVFQKPNGGLNILFFAVYSTG